MRKPKKESTKDRYSVLEGNPSREERIQALFKGKVIQVVTHRTTYYKLDKYQRLCFSYTNHPDSFQPFHEGFNYYHVMDDYDSPGGNRRKRIIITE